MDNLKTKDLIVMGIFFVIYFSLYVVLGFMGMVPILVLFFPFISAIVVGPIVMLYMAKVPKKWGLFIFGMLGPLIFFMLGQTFILPLVALIFVSLAEYFFRKGNFKSFKYNTIAYGFFSAWICGNIIQILLVKEKFEEYHKFGSMPDGYFDKLDALVSWPVMILIIIGAFVGGLIGAYLGKLMLKKHFEKAGIV